MNQNQKDDSAKIPSLNQLEQQVNQASDELMQNALKLGTTIPAVNTNETDKDYEVDMALPGYNKNDLKVEVDDGVLCVTSNASNEKDQKMGNKVVRQEYSYSQFQRKMAVPANCDSSKATAQYKNGVLKITAPKSQHPDNNVKKDVPVQ